MVITLGNWAMQLAERSRVDKFLAVSNAVASANGLANRRLPFEVVPNFVPDGVAENRDPDHPALRALPDQPFWLFVGALSEHKGISVLLDAYRSMEGAPPLVLIGPRWHDTPSTFPANTVIIDGLPHPAVMQAWHRSSLAIIPSVFPDPCPTVAMEAMACGVPIVASRVGGLPDLVLDGETGILVEEGNASKLRAALIQVMNDDAAVAAMGRAARDHVKRFTAGPVIDRIEEIYRELSGSRVSGKHAPDEVAQ
jgi:glycosyltransferase involved in cell wall biosynthesis